MAGFIKVAHRGASGNFPENTRLAFAKAIEARVDMIELDCQLSQDGHVVVFHDERLRRTAGVRGKVSDRSLEQLKKLDVGQWRKKTYKGERILTLEEGLENVGGKVGLFLCFKNFSPFLQGIELQLFFTLRPFRYFNCTI